MRFLAMTNHYVYEPDFCNPAAGWVEPLVRHWFKPKGEGGKSRRTSAIPATRYFKVCRTSSIWPR